MPAQSKKVKKKFSSRDMIVNGGVPALGACAAVLAVSGPMALAVLLGAAAGVSGVVLTNEIPQK